MPDQHLTELYTRSWADGCSLMAPQDILSYTCKSVWKTEKTLVEWDWDKTIMGPILDQRGDEQGGPNSSDQYKLYNNEQFRSAQDSLLGVNIGLFWISSIAQADDSVLLSSDIHQLSNLLQLTLQYCHKYKVVMTPEKSKLQVFLYHHSTTMFSTSRLSTTWLSMVSPSPSLTAPSMWASFSHQDVVIFLTSSIGSPPTRLHWMELSLLVFPAPFEETLLHLSKLKSFMLYRSCFLVYNRFTSWSLRLRSSPNTTRRRLKPFRNCTN